MNGRIAATVIGIYYVVAGHYVIGTVLIVAAWRIR